jgi:sterol desaturase/sphingolipid hydroxylase (fatty acid hydroxylase superfamily)
VVDLTRLATPLYFGTMAIEHRVLARRAARRGPAAGDYARPDTLASLTMGTVSLVMPLVSERLTRAVAPGRGRWARRLVGTTVAAVAATTMADRIVRRARTRAGTGTGTAVDVGADTEAAAAPASPPVWAVRVQQVGGVAAVAGAVVLATATAADRTGPRRLWARGRRRDLGAGPLAWFVAVLGWDLIYYWNHRLMHEVRLLWAHHVVHHSSERYNLSTALRQPVSPFGVWVPYGLLAHLGVRPSIVEQSRGINLLYQYWIHTETVDRLGPGEEVLNTPSHHRVHHGSNRRYIDRNHGGILIIWDRLFGTFEREADDEPVAYGLTRNIGTFRPWRIATHEYADMLRDVARSDNWRDRVSFVLRGPGWAYRRRAERDGGRAATVAVVSPRRTATPAPLAPGGMGTAAS